MAWWASGNARQPMGPQAREAGRLDRRVLGTQRAGVGPAPQQGIFVGRVVVVFGTGPGTGFFEYNGSPAGPVPGPANPPVAYAAPPGVTEDPYGNVLPNTSGGFTAVSAVMVAQLFAGALRFRHPAPDFAIEPSLAAAGSNSLGAVITLDSGNATGATDSQLILYDSIAVVGLGGRLIRSITDQLVIQTANVTPSTTALLEVDGTITAVNSNITASGLGVVEGGGGLNAGVGNVVIGQSGSALTIHEGTPPAAIASTGILAADPSAAPAWVRPSGSVELLSGAQAADLTQFTITQATATQCTKAWSIPAGDAQVGTVYRLRFSGTGTQGSTQETLRFQFSNGNAAIAYVATFVGAGGAFLFDVEMEITIITTGAAGTANYRTKGSANNAPANGYTQAGAFNTAAAFTLEGQAQWGAVTGAPTLTCFSSYLERIGP